MKKTPNKRAGQIASNTDGEFSDIAVEALASKQINNKTAEAATNLLKKKGYRIPTSRERLALVVAFAKSGAVIYKKAFDAFKAPDDLDILDSVALEKRFREIKIFELKSTNRNDVREDFGNYFFSMSTAELLVAQSLREQFRFVMVNIQKEIIIEMSLSDVFKKAKGIHPSWSIRF